MTSSTVQHVFTIVRDENLDLLQKVVEKRLPASCFIYNQLKTYSKMKKDLTLFTYTNQTKFEMALDDNIGDEDNLWIISRHMREDWGSCIYISPPLSSLNKPLPVTVATALTQSSYLDWSKPFAFVCVDTHISEFLIKYNIRQLRNVIKIYPTYVFYMEPEDALQLDTNPPTTSIKLCPLDTSKGKDFICRLWSYTKPETTAKFIHKSIKNYVSGGVLVNSLENPESSLVCAGIVPASGLLSCLVTHPDHRRKGYASLVTKYMFKEMALQGYYPCLDAEINDPAAVAFHKSIPGNRVVAEVDYICHKVL